MARVQFGWLMPVRFAQDRAAYLDGIERSLAIIAGRFDSVWCAPPMARVCRHTWRRIEIGWWMDRNHRCSLRALPCATHAADVPGSSGSV